jgi:NIMA (never in mitosis gene a)-related kinase
VQTQDEVRVLRALRHPNIVRYLDAFSEGGRQHVVMEFCKEGDLEKWIKGRQGRAVPEDEAMLRFVQLCLGLQQVHAQVRGLPAGLLF